MDKIAIGTYTKEQLFTILGSTDLSNIKRDLTKKGYKYTTNGKRGNNYRLEITAVPAAVYSVSFDNFRKCCKEELGITENIDFEKLAILICFLEYDTNFVDYTLEQKERRIREEGFIITRKTIAKYLDILDKNNILWKTIGEYVYYVPLDNGPKFISRETWSMFWNTYYNSDNKSYYTLLALLGNKPKRRNKQYFGNAIIPAYWTLLENAKQIVKEIRNNEQDSIH